MFEIESELKSMQAIFENDWFLIKLFCNSLKRQGNPTLKGQFPWNISLILKKKKKQSFNLIKLTNEHQGIRGVIQT